MTRKPRRSRAVRKNAKLAPRKKAALRKGPRRDPLDAFIAAGVQALDLRVEHAWLPAVRGHLKVTLQLGASVEEFVLPDDAQPAPVFEA